MDKESVLNKITEIGTCEDDATRRAMLAELSEATEEVFNNNASLIEEKNALAEDLRKANEANMDLFLQVNKNKKAEDEGDPEPPKDKLKFENLFNEKGELK